MTGSPAGRFAGLACLVTGSTGMAADAARSLARDGAAVLVASRTAGHAAALADELGAAGGRAAWIAGDLAEEAAAEAAVARCVGAFGRLDALLGIAGASARGAGDGPLDAASLAGWEAALRTNATSQFLVARAAIRAMRAQAPRDVAGRRVRGSVLLMSSVLATRPAPAHFATHGYAAAKGAIEALVRAAAAAYAADGIRVNGIAPSLVATPMSRRAQDDPAIRTYLARRQPLAGGPLDPAEVTAVALHLLSDEARMVTGQVVTVDGGWSVAGDEGVGTGA